MRGAREGPDLAREEAKAFGQGLGVLCPAAHCSGLAGGLRGADGAARLSPSLPPLPREHRVLWREASCWLHTVPPWMQSRFVLESGSHERPAGIHQVQQHIMSGFRNIMNTSGQALSCQGGIFMLSSLPRLCWPMQQIRVKDVLAKAALLHSGTLPVCEGSRPWRVITVLLSLDPLGTGAASEHRLTEDPLCPFLQDSALEELRRCQGHVLFSPHVCFL